MAASFYLIMAILGLTGWVGIARLIRGEFLKGRALEYVSAARALGASDLRIILRHVLPNAVAPVLVAMSFGVSGAVLTESGLSFLGIGVPAQIVTWGSILTVAQSNNQAWWLAVFPGAAIFITMIAYNLLGDGLRDALDPRDRGARPCARSRTTHRGADLDPARVLSFAGGEAKRRRPAPARST